MYGVTASSLHHYPHAFAAAGNHYTHFSSQSPFSQRSGSAAGSLASVYGGGYSHDWGLGGPGGSPLLGSHHPRDAHDYLSPCAVSTAGGHSPSAGRKEGASPSAGQQPAAGQTFPGLYPGYLAAGGGGGSADKVGALAALSVNTQGLKEAGADSKQPGKAGTRVRRGNTRIIHVFTLSGH